MDPRGLTSTTLGPTHTVRAPPLVKFFKKPDARDHERFDELTGNVDMGRDLGHFTDGLSAVFQRMAKALKPGAPLAFTYHHNKLEAYFPVAVAILDAGLTCTASLPCPAEMGASIHISGTDSSIVDTVFVCRSTGVMRRQWLAGSPREVAKLVENDLQQLREGHVRATPGNIRCTTYGHLIRLAIWSLRSGWDKTRPSASRLAEVETWLRRFGGYKAVERHIKQERAATLVDLPLFAAPPARRMHEAEGVPNEVSPQHRVHPN